MQNVSWILMPILMWVMAISSTMKEHYFEGAMFAVCGAILAALWVVNRKIEPVVAPPVECWPNTDIPVTMEWAITSEASEKVDWYVRSVRKRIMDEAEYKVIKDGTRRITLQVIEEVIHSYE